MRSRSGDTLEVEVDIDDLTGSLDTDRIEALASLPEAVLAAEQQSGPWKISIAFTTDGHLRDLHAAHLGDPSDTDILTFDYETDESGARMGEIIISTERATEQAEDAAWSAQQELEFLVVHGMLHLAGWDDATEAARSAMHERQRKILELRRGLA
jgi:rRNA maturation RNase YbeY